jgi:hypothetical protein
MAAGRVDATLDTSEAEAVLVIVDLNASGKTVPEAAWQTLFASEPYRRLKLREAAIGQQFGNPSLAFTDGDFRKFVLSDDLKNRASALKSTLAAWKKIDLNRTAARDLAYLPNEAFIRAKVFAVIKPRKNSFVWDLKSDPTIFLYLNPEVGEAKFVNTVAHELHHIGLGSVGPVYEKKIAALPERARTAASWMGSFGEGFAMLAAAGGPDVHPHAVSLAAERARWDADTANFATDLAAVNQFFLDALHGTFPNQDAIDVKGSSFFGVQGPWYTVGYKMAAMVEKKYGRAVLIQTMLDPRCLLVRYNRAAAEENAAGKPPLPLWSEEVLTAVQAGGC